MSRICQTCGRSSNRANNRSHSNVATKRQQYANLQVKKIGGIKVKICTRCIKTMSTKLAEKTGVPKPGSKKVVAKAAPAKKVVAKKVVAKKAVAKKAKK